MNITKCFATLILFVLSSVPAFSQTIRVKKETVPIKGGNTEGYAIVLNGKTINDSFVKYLKTFSKVKQGFNFHTLTETTFNGKHYAPNIYAQVKENENNGEAWLGIKTEEWPADEITFINQQLEKILYDFGRQFYRDKIQVQIDESNRALQAVERQQQKLINQNKDLNNALEGNKLEKTELEKSLVNNKVKYETLLQQIEQNKKDQDSVKLAGDQIKKVIEMQKSKQQKVGE